MTFELLDDDPIPGGMAGSLILFDETPRVNPARVRPFVIAVLLLRGGVRAREVTSSLSPHVHPDDLRSWEGDETQLEAVVHYTLHNMVEKRILRRNDDGLYVLADTAEGARLAITATSALDAQLPDHLLQEIGRKQFIPQS